MVYNDRQCVEVRSWRWRSCKPRACVLHAYVPKSIYARKMSCSSQFRCLFLISRAQGQTICARSSTMSLREKGRACCRGRCSRCHRMAPSQHPLTSSGCRKSEKVRGLPGAWLEFVLRKPCQGLMQ